MAGSKRKSGGSLVGGAMAFVALSSFVSPGGEALVGGLGVLLAWSLAIGLLVALAWVAWRLWRMIRTPKARGLEVRFEAVRSMGGAQFEFFMADLFRAMGHKAVVLGGAGDQGVDIVVVRRGERVAVQCKNYKTAVGNKPVQEVYAGARHHRCVDACVVAPAGYTRGARELAKSTDVSLFDAEEIRRWIRKVDRLERGKARAGGAGREGRRPREASPPPASRDEAIQEARKRAFWHPHPDDPPKT